MKVYLVEDCENAPGRILKVFADKRVAERYASGLPDATRVVERVVTFDNTCIWEDCDQEAVYCEGHAKEAQPEPPSHEETLRLVLDLTVALEGLRFPDLRDSRVDPQEVNDRALGWLKKHTK